MLRHSLERLSGALSRLRRQVLLFEEPQRNPRRNRSTKARKSPTSTRVSDPTLRSFWETLVTSRFPERTDLLAYTVTWSTRRQRRTLASCCVPKQRVVVAKELNRPEHSQWLEALLYHEMCHAVLGANVGVHKGKHAWHGPRFRNLERMHPGITALNAWIKQGGWARAVRSDRARQSAAGRKKVA